MIDLPPGWVCVRLDEIAEVRLGRQRSPKNHSGENMRPYLRAANVGWGGLLLDDVKEMNFSDSEAKIYHLQPGDIVLSEASGSPGEVGKPALWNGEIEDCCFQNTLIRVRSRGPYPKFLLHYLRAEALRGEFVRHSRGVGIHHLGAARLSGWLINLPPLDEQHRIVAALEGHLSRLEIGKRYLDAMSIRSAGMNSRVVDYALNGLGYYPVQPLGSLLREPLRNGYSSRASKDGTGVRTLTLTAVTLNDFSDNYTKMTTADADRVRGLWLCPGDILIQRSNTPQLVGSSALYSGPENWAIFPDLMIRVRVSNVLLPEYVRLVLASGRVRQRMRDSAKGLAGSMPKIDQGVIERLEIPVPPKSVQCEFVRTVRESQELVERLLAAGTVAKKKVASLRTALLTQAFSGQLVR